MTNILFYDGDCGLCHATVQFALKRDPDGRFSYAPLQGETWAKLAAAQSKPGAQSIRSHGVNWLDPPDSVLLLTDSELLVRSAAVERMLLRLNKPWPTIGRLLSLFPRVLSDLGYRITARARRLVFRQPEGLCPLVPTEYRPRFLN